MKRNAKPTTMLAYPFADTQIDAGFVKLLNDSLRARLVMPNRSDRLEGALVDLLYLAIQKRAGEVHGVSQINRDDFRFGSGLVAYELATMALDHIEDWLTNFLDGDGVDSSLFEEILARGQLCLSRGEIVDGVLRLPYGAERRKG